MPVPDYETLMRAVLEAFASGATRVSETLPHLRATFHIPEEEAQALLPSGRTTILASRAHWARTYLAGAGCLSSPKRNVHVITDRGRKLLAAHPGAIDNAVLSSFPEFKAWYAKARKASGEGAAVSSASELANALQAGDQPASTQTPEEAMKAAHDLLDATLRDDLLAQLADLHPVRFERLILDLLSAMGFGGGDLSRAQMTKVSGDGGIDGIIHEDALGLDRVYIQAKRYGPGNNVGSPAIYQFAGSLTEQGAAKGVFVTTSDFTKEARSVAAKITQHRIVLIDGQELARLMIRYGVGVRPRTTFTVHGIDEDYFKPADA